MLLPACCGLVLLTATPGTCAVLAVFQKGNLALVGGTGRREGVGKRGTAAWRSAALSSCGNQPREASAHNTILKGLNGNFGILEFEAGPMFRVPPCLN